MIAGLLGLAARPQVAGAYWEDGGPCDSPVMDIQFCWDEVWYNGCTRVCQIWCWVVWESADHGQVCAYDIIVLGYC